MQLFRVTLRFFMAWDDPDIFRRMQESAFYAWARIISFYYTVSPRIFRSIPLATTAATTLLAPHQPTHVPRWQDEDVLDGSRVMIVMIIIMPGQQARGTIPAVFCYTLLWFMF